MHLFSKLNMSNQLRKFHGDIYYHFIFTLLTYSVLL